MKLTINRKRMGMAVLLGAGLLMGGCKSAPELTATQAQALIQAKYDQSPAVPASIVVYDLGMRQGVTAKYWDRAKAYPNNFWADFKLTPEGKKAVALPGGGDMIQWRPESAEDKNYSLAMSTVAPSHLKARDVGDPQDGVDGAKTAVYTESYKLDGVPDALQQMAHDPGNQLGAKRTAAFVLDGRAWKLESIN